MIKNLEHTTIGILFGRSNNFVVPRYQRGYAWGEEHLIDFCADLEKCIKRRVHGGEKLDHFFGGLVCVQNQIAGSGRIQYEIVDGQQRISTFVMLVSRIVKKYKSIEQERRTAGDSETADLIKDRYVDLEKKYIKFQDEINRKRVWVNKLELSKVDFEFYDRLINCQEPTKNRASHERIEFSKNYIEKFIDKIIRTDNLDNTIDDLRFIEEVLNDDINIILIATETKGDAYKLFQVLNDRGVSLTEGDLLRAKTLECLEDPAYSQIQEEVSNLWDEILSDEDNATGNYLKWYYSSKIGRAPSGCNLFDEFKDEFFKVKNEDEVTAAEANAIKKEVELLRDAVIILRKISDGQWPYSRIRLSVGQWDKSRLSILMKDLGHSNCVPLLLSAFKLKQKTFAELVYILERFVFRFKIICNEHISRANSIYLDCAKKINKNPEGFNIEELKTDLRSLLDEKTSGGIFLNHLENDILYSETRSNKILKYFLISVEENIRSILNKDETPSVKDKTRVFDQASTTIEHVYPRNPDGNEIVEELEPLKNRLGNLSILGPQDNVQADNSKFDEKKPLLAATSIILNQKLALNEEWNKEIVNKRTKELIEYADRIFYF